jgi:hypothetical protein
MLNIKNQHIVQDNQSKKPFSYRKWFLVAAIVFALIYPKKVSTSITWWITEFKAGWIIK